MAKTKAQVRNRALEMLGKIRVGQSAPANLANDMDDVYDQVYARLERRGLVSWSSTDSIPDEFVEDITTLMAFERSEGIPSDRYQRISLANSRALAAISANISGRWVNPREYTDY